MTDNSTQIQISVNTLNGLFAYILSGWKNVRKFLGPAVVSVMKDMGNVLYNLLLENNLIQPCDGTSLERISKYAVETCQVCLIPVSDVSIDSSGNTLTIELVEKKESHISEALKKDESWVFLPFPMISLLYYLLIKNIGLPPAPVKFNMNYEHGKWIFSFVFSKSIEHLIHKTT